MVFVMIFIYLCNLHKIFYFLICKQKIIVNIFKISRDIIMKSSEIYMCAKSIKTIWMKFWTETPPPFFVVSLFLQEIMDLTSFEIVKNNHHASLNKGGVKL